MQKPFFCSVKYVHINKAFFPLISVQTFPVGVLPEGPPASVRQRGMSDHITNPDIIIFIGSGKVKLIGSFGGVEDRLETVMVLQS